MFNLISLQHVVVVADVELFARSVCTEQFKADLVKHHCGRRSKKTKMAAILFSEK